MAHDWSRHELEELVTLIYVATTEHEQWAGVIERIGRKLGSDLAAVHVHARPGDPEPATTVGAWGRRAPAGLRDYGSYYAARNIWLQRGAHLLKAGAVLTGEQMCPDDVLLRSEFYRDFLRILNVRYSIRAVLTSDPEPLSYFSAARPPSARPFGDRERRILERVTPHLVQAIRIHERLEAGQARRRAVAGALDRLPLAVIFLDGRCRVVEMNAPARKLVDAADGLRVERGVLAAYDSRADVQLQQMIFGAAAMATGRLLQHGGAVSLGPFQGSPPALGDRRPNRRDGDLPGVPLRQRRGARRRAGAQGDRAVCGLHEELQAEPRGGRRGVTLGGRDVLASDGGRVGHQGQHGAEPLETHLREDRGAPSVRSRPAGSDLRRSAVKVRPGRSRAVVSAGAMA